MTEGAWQQRVPVIGTWAPPQRKKASLGSTVAGAALLLFAVAAVAIGGTQAGTFLLVILVLLVLMLVFQALVVVTGLQQQPLAGDAGAGTGAADWQGAYAPPPAQEAAPAEQQLTLKCSSCGTVFDVTDTGERPLRHVCPGCGSEGLLTEADIGPGHVAAETAAAEPSTITLKCGNCATVFDVTDTGERPLRHVCPGCGSEGILREEDIGPAPAAAPAPAAEPEPAYEAPAPPARAAHPAAPAARAATKTVKTLKLRCKNCSTVFTLRDTGERPLYHECPGCKATGVLR